MEANISQGVRVLLLNVDARQSAMLHMAFKMRATDHYTIIEDGQGVPDLVLVDGDGQDGQKEWLSAKQRYESSVIVFFARKPPEITAPYLAKPLKFDTLFTSLRNLRNGNGIWLADSDKANVSNGQDSSKSGSGNTAPLSHAQSQKTASGGQETQRVSIHRFSCDGTLLGALQGLAQQTQDTAITLDNKPLLIVFPSIQRVFVAVSGEELREFSMQAGLVFQTRPIPEGSEQLRDKAKITLQSCIWQLAVWTANGRLMSPIRPDTIMKLKAWPNMTRLAYLPESMRLSAFLVKTPVALATLYKLLPVDMADILNYVAATYATGFLQIQQPVTNEPNKQTDNGEVTMSRERQHTEDAADEHSGMLQRLMGRLRRK
ncbi:hypothetical protein [Stenoxybacter acetivorans]|uniref:hypothetical protein n=1 Tax=Stenoxybacter acetivorans TaxID=422441 RepID=UPI00055EEEDD|nr:hypothetical protein [Stenoxybacter acetivorans]